MKIDITLSLTREEIFRLRGMIKVIATSAALQGFHDPHFIGLSEKIIEATEDHIDANERAMIGNAQRELRKSFGKDPLI